MAGHELRVHVAELVGGFYGMGVAVSPQGGGDEMQECVGGGLVVAAEGAFGHLVFGVVGFDAGTHALQRFGKWIPPQVEIGDCARVRGASSARRGAKDPEIAEAALHLPWPSLPFRIALRQIYQKDFQFARKRGSGVEFWAVELEKRTIGGDATMDWNRFRNQMIEGLRDFVRMGLRWSYLVIGGLIILGIILNVFLLHGWWVWPFVFVAGMMTMIHEAADRNGEGIPPFQGYALFVAVIGLWVLIAVVLTWVGPLILLGVPPLVIYGTRIFVKNHKRIKLVANRRAGGQCIHCGEPALAGYVLCVACGREPGLDEGKPVQIGPVAEGRKQRARETLDAGIQLRRREEERAGVHGAAAEAGNCRK